MRPAELLSYFFTDPNTGKNMRVLFIDFETTRFKEPEPLPKWHKNLPVGFGYYNIDQDRVSTTGYVQFYDKTGDSPRNTFNDFLSKCPFDVLVAHNLHGFDLHWFRELVGEDEWHSKHKDKIFWCTMIAEYMLQAQDPVVGLSLGELCVQHKLSHVKSSDEVQEYWNKGIDTDKIPYNTLRTYCLVDVQALFDLFWNQLQRLYDIPKKYGKSLFPLMLWRQSSALVTFDITWNGIKYDQPHALASAEWLDGKIESEQINVNNWLRSNLPKDYVQHVEKNGTIDVGSPTQLSLALFGGPYVVVEDQAVLDEHGVPYRYKSGLKIGEVKTKKKKVTRTAPNKVAKILGKPLVERWFSTGLNGLVSVDDYTLDLLETHIPPTSSKIHWVVGEVKKLRAMRKMSTTYLRGYSEFYNPYTSCIHPKYNETVTATGRLSSSKPNLQNTPKKPVLGTHIKDKFIARDYHRFVEIDFSGMELHGLAMLSEDKTLTQQLLDGIDLHTTLAREALGKHSITEDERNNAKSARFASLYGAKVDTMVKKFGMEKEQARMYLDTLSTMYPGVEKFVETVSNQVHALENWKEVVNPQGEHYFESTIQSISGRLYKFKQTLNPRTKKWYYRPTQIRNYVVQGFSTADVVPIALSVLWDWCNLYTQNYKYVRFVGTVHDSLLLEIDESGEHVTDLSGLVQQIVQVLSKDTVPVVENLVGRKIAFKEFPVKVKTGYDWFNLTEHEV